MAALLAAILFGVLICPDTAIPIRLEKPKFYLYLAKRCCMVFKYGIPTKIS